VSIMAKKRGKKPKPAGDNPWPAKVLAIRTKLGLTQTAAAARIRVGPAVWSAWENGLRKPSRQCQLLLELLEAETI